LFNLVIEIRKKEDLRGLEMEEILGIEVGLMGFEED
jgi:hypothetical protein